MVVAKTDAGAPGAQPNNSPRRAAGPLQRGYLAFVWGAPAKPKGVIDAPLDRHPHARDKRAVREGGREAVTHWQDASFLGGDGKPVASLIACTLETGAHQIRVHLAHIDHPILGDATYSSGYKTKASLLSPPARAALDALGRQALHAYLLSFQHPDSGELLEFRSQLPDDLRRLHAALALAVT